MSTPHMSMTLPVPLTTAGPLWAVEVTAALNTIDSHDHLPGSGAPLGIHGSGVLGVTYIFRPNGSSGDPAEMSAFIIHGKHVTSFTRPTGGTYVIGLDREYEADEIMIVVNPLTCMYDYLTNGDPGGPGDGMWGGSLICVPVSWQTGPTGLKSERMITVHGISIDPVNHTFMYAGKHTDPLSIMLVFFDRNSCDYHGDRNGNPTPVP